MCPFILTFFGVLTQTSFVINLQQESLIEKYKDSCEKVDIRPLLRNRHLVDGLIRCLLHESKCTREGLLLREVIPEILETTCSTCSEKQKQIVRTVMNYIYTNRPSDFNNIFNEFDPEHKYRSKMMVFMNQGENAMEALHYNTTMPIQEYAF